MSCPNVHQLAGSIGQDISQLGLGFFWLEPKWPLTTTETRSSHYANTVAPGRMP